MRRPIKIALITAALIAILNIPPTFAIDVGLPDNASWFQQFIAGEWVYMHVLGLWLVRLVPFYNMPLDIFFAFLSGYVEWAALLVAGFYACLGVRRLAQRLSGKRA